MEKYIRSERRIILGEGYLARHTKDHTHLVLLKENDLLAKRVKFKKTGIKGKKVRLIAEIMDGAYLDAKHNRLDILTSS